MSVLFTKRSASVLKSSPWINGLIHSLKRSCRKPEHLWRKSRLQVHLIYVKDILVSFTNSVRETRAACSPVWFLKAQAILRFCLTLLITCHLTSTVKIKKKSLILEITFLCQLSISAPAQLVNLDHFILVSLPEPTQLAL